MPKILMAYMKKLFRFAKAKLMLDLILIIVLGLLEGVGIVMLLPLLTYAGISSGSEQGGLGQIMAQFLQPMGIKLTLPLVLVVYTSVIVGQSWLQRYEGILHTAIQESFDTFLTTELYRALTYSQWSLFLSVKKSKITHVITTELMRVSSCTYYLLQVFATGVIAAIQIGIAFILAPYLTLLVIGSGVILFFCMHFLSKEARRIGMNISNFTGDIFSEIIENLNGIKEVKSYGIEQLQIKNFETRRKKLEQTYIDLTRVRSMVTMFYKIAAAVFISLFFYTAIQVFKTDAQSFLIIVVIFSRLWPKFSSFQSSLQYAVMMLPAFQAVSDLHTLCIAKEEIPVLDRIVPPMNLRRGIRLSDVSFRYNVENECYAVRHINGLLSAGSTTAIVGVSGAGKSTLADIIIGLILPEQGEILIDDIRLDSSNMSSWRQSIGYVPQDAFLFNASIRDNLTWACPDANEKEMWEVLKLAAIDDFVKALPEKLDTVVGDRGIRLSGGERQRIVLARALLRKPELLILDEATSALDSENEKRIQNAIEGLQGKLTILIIAHRMSTIKNADQIMVLDQGRIVEQGSYQDVASDENGRFYKLASL
ncbi:Lipid A export ATP-binding/permease protein MsbA [Desulfosporosinus sp. I2]|uniref:ABC transporter ATP-binding protein n=1 Tax=Desulfosporosinus sp. I2 TaxID=1617025 RepID=UPI0005F04786|nr:ABC transporter ATP-binding protein [Desulfosporosinus sp. I2]KJR49321.1 Lipid A export ATP-binding/permease protein MsbA [Desulfosporosinus sp. I2]